MFDKPIKYRNKKVEILGINFASKLESNIYLKILEYQKKYDFTFFLQPKYELESKFTISGKAFRSIDYIADFEIFINGKVHVVDAKGIETPVFALKKKMFAKKYGKEIVCVKSVKQFVKWFEEVKG